jgi:hypothetical protein
VKISGRREERSAQMARTPKTCSNVCFRRFIGEGYLSGAHKDRTRINKLQKDKDKQTPRFDQLNEPASDSLDRTSSGIRDGFCSLLEELEYELAVR